MMMLRHEFLIFDLGTSICGSATPFFEKGQRHLSSAIQNSKFKIQQSGLLC
jgi:hypothetical protein